MDVSYAVDGVQLFHPESYWWLEDDLPVGLNLQRRDVNMQVAGRDGAIGAFNESVEVVQIGLKMIVNARHGKSAAESFEALMAVFHRRTGYLTLTRSMFNQITSARVKLSAITDVKRIATGDSITFTAVFTIPDVYFRDVDYLLWSRNAPVSNTVYYVDTLDNSAVDIRDAQIKLIGPMTNPVLNDVGSNNFVSVSTIPAGKQVIIDCASGYAYTKNTDVSTNPSAWDYTNSVDISTQLNSSGPDSAKNVFCMAPTLFSGDPFVRQVGIKLTASGMTAASAIHVRARRCFL